MHALHSNMFGLGVYFVCYNYTFLFLLEHSGSRTLTVEDLRKKCNVTDDQLNKDIDLQDIGGLAQCFDNVDDYLQVLGLAPGEQTDIQQIAHHKGTLPGMREALKRMIKKNPFRTFRELVEIALKQDDGMTAKNICCYVSEKGK